MNSSARLSTRSDSQPEPIVPTKSNTPISASNEAAVTEAMPKSPQKAMKWVWMRPFVLRPQMKNVPARIQKVGLGATSPSTRNAAPKAGLVAGGGAMRLSRHRRQARDPPDGRP